MTPIAIILLIVLLVLATALILTWIIIRSIDWDQEDEALLCDSYKEMQTTQESEVASNPGKI